MDNSEFYDILIEASQAAGGGNMERCYHLLNIVLHRSVDTRLAGSSIHFGGLFAKTDYLCREHGVAASVANALNALRRRLRNVANVDEEKLRSCWPADIEALTLFLYAIFRKDEDRVETAVPQALREVFPKCHRKERGGRKVGDAVRMIVDRWDDRHIYGTTDELGEVVVVIPEGYEDIVRLLDRGALLNVVKPREGVDLHINEDMEVLGGGETGLTAEMLVYQPDYLVDISSVASCFESYADTPYVALLNRLKSVTPTKAIHLGNLASQFLDEEVHGEDRSYAESITEFFHHHALDMAAAEDIDSTFHADAQKQKENIRIAVREGLEREVGAFDARKVLLEPSFFCEMLGLQGRMDLLQCDYRVLIEQKSGKGAFDPRNTDPDVPRYQEKHYVQMLLYRAMLHYAYKRDGHRLTSTEIQSFLLYSKYKKGLVRMASAPELLCRAMMLRNQIAWCELSYVRGGGDVLLRMTPEALRRKTMSDNFWNTWIRPQLANILNPIQDATDIEKAYFLRMLRFVATEHVLSKMGNNNKEDSGFAAKWHSSLEDKLLAGNILHDGMLEVTGEHSERVTFTAGSLSAIPNFRIGDIVVLYPYQRGHEPDIRKQMVHRCSIETISVNGSSIKVSLLLRNPQTGSSVFKVRTGFRWALEHDFYESSATALYQSLHRFLTAPAHRKALILSMRQPEFDNGTSLLGDYGVFNDLVLKARQAKDLFLVLGPPGTGKTSFGMLNILKEHLLSPGSVLIMSYTNRAVDEICSKLVEEGLDFMRIGSPLSCEKPYHPYLIGNKTAGCSNIGEVKELVDSMRIFVGTTTAVTRAADSLFRLKTFSLAIVDEASQILEPQLLGLLSATDGLDVAIKKFVLIGDHKQLPAVVQQSEEESKVTDEILLRIGLENCRNSLFQRLHDNIMKHDANSQAVYMLSKQGRMHPVIAEFPNAAFYDGRLGIAGLNHQLEACDSVASRLSFIAVPKPVHSESDKVNEAEAHVIAREVVKAWKEAGDSFDPLATVGVIVPYRNQITAVRKAVAALAPKLGADADAVTIDTVERYQGSQRDVIIYGFTVQYRYQLKFLTSATFTDAVTNALIDRRLNVALTRARKREVIVGNPDIIAHADVFRKLVEYSKDKGAFFEVEE